MDNTSPFHAGEQAVQTALGIRATIEPWARQVIRPFFPDQHRAFHTALPFLVIAARDAAGRPWVTLLGGNEGFITSPNDRELLLDATPQQDDPLHDQLQPGKDIGLLGIDLATRRRNRANGRIGKSEDGRLRFCLDQSFGNCSQYIREREWVGVPPLPLPAEWVGVPPLPGQVMRGNRLTGTQQLRISAADTLFIGSGYRGEGDHPAYGMDASHRGGAPGFVHVASDTRLVIPDYAGNQHFNTIGNLLLDPRAGLTFIEFESGSALHLTGTVRIETDDRALADHPGAHRLLVFDVDETLERAGSLPFRWKTTGDGVRSMRVAERTEESRGVVSLTLASRDGGPLPAFQAGQHLPLELRLANGKVAARTYSLSGAPGRTTYRITVRHQVGGQVSSHLHQQIEVGAVLDARLPTGEFVLDHGTRPVVLLSAGIGITPMVSMLHELADETVPRPVRFIHAARDETHLPLMGEVRALLGNLPDAKLHVALSAPDAVPATTDITAGRLDAGQVLTVAGATDADFYLCGPPAFMAAMQAGLVDLGVQPARLHAETFGPAALPTRLKAASGKALAAATDERG